MDSARTSRRYILKSAAITLAPNAQILLDTQNTTHDTSSDVFAATYDGGAITDPRLSP